MTFTAKSGSASSATTDLLVLLSFAGSKIEVPAGYDEGLKAAKSAGDLPDELGKSCLLYPSGKAQQKRVLVLGLGEFKKLDEDAVRRLAAVAVQKSEELGATDYVIGLPPKLLDALPAERIGLCLGEGTVMGSYTYQPPSREKAKPRKTKRGAAMVTSGKLAKALQDAIKTGVVRGEAVCFARELGNRAGNLATPRILAREAKGLTGKNGIKVRVLDEAQMKKADMGALLGVSRGSSEPPRLIVLDYSPRGAKQTVCVVGKGLTFDAGGISLKPSLAMDEMRYDMCGGAAVLGLFHALSRGAAKPKCRVVGIVGSSENLPDGSAQKPGDVVRACNGVTIEVLNTDAEGRLVLADALAYAKKTYKPAAIVDLATLTGAVIIALGHEVTAAIGNDQKLVDEILDAGERSGDQCWQLPMWEVHREQMKSKFADLRNINSGKSDGGGSIAGASFLSYFVDEVPWVHLDIAGTAWGAKAKDYYLAGATGVGVRILLDWVASRR